MNFLFVPLFVVCMAADPSSCYTITHTQPLTSLEHCQNGIDVVVDMAHAEGHKILYADCLQIDGDA